jgi:hypothetical protein
MILLCRNTEKAKVNCDPSSAFCVRHKSYLAPPVGPGCIHLTWEQFELEPYRYIESKKTMIVVGLNRLLTPSNRVKRGPLLLRPYPNLRRVSVDRCLFVSEPWKAWFHFGCVGAPYGQFTYSFLAESRWRAWHNDERGENPFSEDEIVRWGEGHISADHSAYFDGINVDVVPVSNAVQTDYEELKEACFAEEKTASAIIQRLAKFAGEVAPERTFPARHRLWAKRSHKMVRTDLPVDVWLVGELLTLASMTDGVARRFHQ